jgi:plastocyanin
MRKLMIGTTVLAMALVACGGGGQTNGGGDQQDAGPGTVTVQAEEYAFTGVPETLAAGEVTFELENVGEEQHEFQLVRITSDLPMADLVELPQKEAQENIEPVGGTFSKPGESGKDFEATLEGGRYGYVCFIPTPEGTPHAALGMFGEFTVE